MQIWNDNDFFYNLNWTFFLNFFFFEFEFFVIRFTIVKRVIYVFY